MCYFWQESQGTGSLLGDWESIDKSQNSFADFANVTTGTNLNGIPSDPGFIPQLNVPNSSPLQSSPKKSNSSMNQSHQSLNSLSSLGGIQRNVSSPNLQTDPFEDFSMYIFPLLSSWSIIK
jgi:hypothetical protein